MNYLLEFQPDAYLRKMADYFAALRPPPLPPTPPSMSARRCWRAAGRWSRKAMRSARRPGLLRLPRPVTDRDGTGHSRPRRAARAAISARSSAPFVTAPGRRPAPDCMQLVAAHLTEADVTAVAAWLASLPVPADPSPVPKGSLAMPLRLRQRTATEERAAVVRNSCDAESASSGLLPLALSLLGAGVGCTAGASGSAQAATRL